MKKLSFQFASLIVIFALIMSPSAHAATMEEFSVALSRPFFSADFDTDPTYTNITYTWKQSTAFQASTGDPCITTGPCFTMTFSLQDTGLFSSGLMQEWQGAVVTGDLSLSNLPANATVSSVTTSDSLPSNGRSESLLVSIDCSAACVFATSTAYTITVVNYQLKNQEAPSPYVSGTYSTTTHSASVFDLTVASQDTQMSTAISAVGQGIVVTASVDPSLSFSIDGVATSTAFYTDTTDVDTSANPDVCGFGTLTPSVPKICAWTLNIATNAANGYTVYVVQDANMASGANTIKQFTNGTRTDDSAATVWSSPSIAQYGHLGYSSSDTSVFPPSGGTVAVWAGIPTIPTASQAPTTTGMVADSASPGDDTYTYALQVESASSLPQGTYTHTEYFMVVGNF